NDISIARRQRGGRPGAPGAGAKRCLGLGSEWWANVFVPGAIPKSAEKARIVFELTEPSGPRRAAPPIVGIGVVASRPARSSRSQTQNEQESQTSKNGDEYSSNHGNSDRDYAPTISL